MVQPPSLHSASHLLAHITQHQFRIFRLACFISVAITETGSHIAKAIPTRAIVAKDVLELLILPPSPKHYDSKHGYCTWMGISSKAWRVVGTHCHNWTIFLVPRCSFCSSLLIVAIKTEICTPGKMFLIHTQIYKIVCVNKAPCDVLKYIVHNVQIEL